MTFVLGSVLAALINYLCTDQVEAALDCDKNFWNGVNYLATVTKRPIVITSTLGSVRRELGMKFDEVDVEMPAKVRLCRPLFSHVLTIDETHHPMLWKCGIHRRLRPPMLGCVLHCCSSDRP